MSFGVIIIRCVVSKETNLLWNESYRCVRNIYKDIKIVIIDDTQKQLKHLIESEQLLYNTIIIESEFSGCGEFLAYYYLYKNKLFSIGLIIHDSVFIQKKIKIENVNNVKFLWHFNHEWDNDIKEINYLKKLKHNINLINFYENKRKWIGCFGVMSIIKFDFIALLEHKYNIFNLIKIIKTRNDRMCVERIFACICNLEQKSISLYGDIHDYLPWGYSFEQYKNSTNNKDIIKVWVGR